MCQNGQNPRCVNGMCRNATCMNLGMTFCNNSCYTTQELQRDPLNCGQCGLECQEYELCVEGACQLYFPAPSCTACPCAACGAGTKCCAVSGTALCVAGTACPP
jgi:hypothetical protein